MRKAAKNKEFVIVFIGERKIETSFDVFPLNRFKTTIKKEMKIEIREMVSFELGKEIEKDVFRLVTNVGQQCRKRNVC